MYRILGSDQKVYGPVNAEKLRQWMTEGRVVLATLVLADGGTEWKPLSSFPEFAPAPPPPSAALPQPIVVPPPHYVSPPQSNSMATAGFIFGIASLIPCCCSSFIFAILGIIFSVIGLNRANQIPNQRIVIFGLSIDKIIAIVGLVCSILGLAGGVFFSFFSLLFNNMPSHQYTWRYHI